MSAASSLAIIAAGAAHAAVLASLHQAAFPIAWTSGDFVRLLEMPGTFALLAGPGDQAPPYGMILCRAAAGEAEILTLCVAPEHRRSGVARCLVEAALERLPAAVVTLFIEVAEANRAARALYRQLGFREVGRRPGYYRTATGRDDALVMARSTGPAAAP